MCVIVTNIEFNFKTTKEGVKRKAHRFRTDNRSSGHISCHSRTWRVVLSTLSIIPTLPAGLLPRFHLDGTTDGNPTGSVGRFVSTHAWAQPSVFLWLAAARNHEKAGYSLHKIIKKHLRQTSQCAVIKYKIMRHWAQYDCLMLCDAQSASSFTSSMPDAVPRTTAI